MTEGAQVVGLYVRDQDDALAFRHRRYSEAGTEFIQEPAERFGSVDASFRDPSGNDWKPVEAR